MFPRSFSSGLSLFDRLVPLTFPAADTFSEPFDVYRFEDRVEVWMDLPGVDPAGFDITVEGREVRIAGERTAPDSTAAVTVSTRRSHGPFERRLHLGRDLSHEAIEADYTDGVLKLVVPLAEAAKPRKVLVGTTAAPALESASGAAG